MSELGWLVVLGSLTWLPYVDGWAGLDSPRGVTHVLPVACMRLAWASSKHGDLRVGDFQEAGFQEKPCQPGRQKPHVSKGGFQV